MALLKLDSFDHYAYADVLQKWNAVNGGVRGANTITTVGRRSTNGLKVALTTFSLQNSSTDSIEYAPGGNQGPSVTGDTCIVGFSFKSATAPSGLGNSSSESSASILVSVRGGSNAVQTFFQLNTDGTISAYNSAGTLLGTTTATIVQNVTYYLEFKVKVDASAGTVDIQRDGFNILALTSKNTGSAGGWNRIRIGAGIGVSGAAVEWDIDDFYLADASGSTWNNFVGDIRVDAIYPNADGNSSNWTLSTGATHYGTVDETPANGDTDYNSTVNIGDKDTLNFPSTTTSGAIIKGLQIVAQTRKTDAGTAGHKSVTRIGSTDYDGTEYAVPSSYIFQIEPQSVKPSDGTAWTESDFNAAEFGYKKST